MGSKPPAKTSLVHRPETKNKATKTLNLTTGVVTQELVWPQSRKTWQQIELDPQIPRETDRFLGPVTSYKFSVDPGSLPEPLAAKLAADLNLPLVSEAQATETTELTVARHDLLKGLLQAVTHDITVFELLGEMDTDSVWRLTSLQQATLDPLTFEFVTDTPIIKKVLVRTAKDLGLPREIPLDYLLIARWRPTANNPYGNSIWRPLHRAWRYRQHTEDAGMIGVHRQAAGLPVIKHENNATAEQIAAYHTIVAEAAAGDRIGAVINKDAEMDIIGVTGSVANTIGWHKIFSDQITQGLEGQTAKLGSAAVGSYALAETLEGMTWQIRDLVAQWISETLAGQVVARWVRWNVGELEDMPTVVWERPPSATPDQTVEQPVDPVTETKQGKPNEIVAFAASDKRRPLTQTELDSGFDFDRLDLQHKELAVELLSAVNGAKVALVERLLNAVKDGKLTAKELTSVALDFPDVQRQNIQTILAVAADLSSEIQVAAAKSQGVTVTPKKWEPIELELLASNILETLAVGTVTTVRKNISRHNQTDPELLIAALTVDIADLTEAFPTELTDTEITRAQRAGINEVLARTANSIKAVYASEILDKRTCSPCSGIDGKRYESLEDALMDYPTGGYTSCKGRGKCRGTLVAEYADEVASRR